MILILQLGLFMRILALSMQLTSGNYKKLKMRKLQVQVEHFGKVEQ